MHARTAARVLAALTLVLGTLSGAAPARAGVMAVVQGVVTDQNRQPVSGVCVVLGPVLPPAAPCASTTDAGGNYSIPFYNVKTLWVLNFLKTGFAISTVNYNSDGISTLYIVNASMTPGVPVPPPHAGTPTQTTYLPNITKTLGGPQGYQTPFIVQNVGTVLTDLQVDFFTFSTGQLVARRLVNALKPGTSFADVPDNDADLSDNSQFSVVVKSFGANVAAVVNQVGGSGSTFVAAAYVGTSSGATSVFLPNVTKRFFGFDAPFIIQNLGAGSTIATASFVSFDGTKRAQIQRNIAPGQSQPIDPNAEPGLVDGTQYAVTVTSAQPISVVVNIVNDPASAPPVFLSMNGLGPAAGGSLYAPYVVKNQAFVSSSVSTIVVQNLGGAAATPSLSFTPLGGGAATTIAGPATAANASWAFDIRYQNGDTTKAACGASASAGCLADGAYSVVVSGGQLGAVVNLVGSTSADSYTALGRAATKFFLPNLTRTLGGSQGWTTPLVVQSVTAMNVTLSWYRFSDGSLVASQQLSLPVGSATLVDPRTVAALQDNTQYSVVVDGNGAQVAAIVTEQYFGGGDGAMIYEGFPAP